MTDAELARIGEEWLGDEDMRSVIAEVRRLRARAEADDELLIECTQAGVQAGMRAANQRGNVPSAAAIVERVRGGER